jgi:dihydrolipoamide dehydrogenase
MGEGQKVRAKMPDFDILILGSGPGGYVAALRAAQLGARVAVIEQDRVGGVCLNVGCIPTKALLRTAEVYRTLSRAAAFGLRVEGSVVADWPAVQARKQSIVDTLVGGVEKLLARACVRVIRGRGRLVDPRTVEIALPGSTERLAAAYVVIATGSRPARLSLPGFDLPGVLDSTSLLALDALPSRVLIVGGGVIGVEFADIFSALGVHVTMVEMLDQLLPLMDADLGRGLAWSLGQRGVEVHVASHVSRLEPAATGLRAVVVTDSGERVVEADRVLVAVGRRPNIEDLGLEAADVYCEKSGIPVDARMRTNIPGVYAIGDVTGGPQLAHVAMRGGEVAVENALGHPAVLDLKTVPWCVYTNPEIAGVGLTEAQARERGHDVRVGRFPLSANGKALTNGETDGFVKVVSEARFGEVLGLHLIAPHASDLIHEGALALALEATLDELQATFHGHPTVGEAVREAALDLMDGALHRPH